MVKQFLSEKGIEFKEVDLTKNPASIDKVMEATGMTAVPQTQIDNTWVVGYDPDKLSEILGV